jgi:hypothetical protein
MEPGWAYGWLWERGSIDTARLGLQFLLVAGVTGLLAYGLRPASLQALAKRKKLAIQSATTLLVVVVVVVTVGTVIYTACAAWEALHWWWDSLPAEQVSKISVVVPVLLTDEEVLAEVSTPKVQAPKAADPLDEILANPPAAKPKGNIFDQTYDILLAHQQQRLVVKNNSGVALRAISIRIYYPGVPVPSTHARVPCFSTPDELTNVTVRMEHNYTLHLRAEVVGAWRQ